MSGTTLEPEQKIAWLTFNLQTDNWTSKNCVLIAFFAPVWEEFDYMVFEKSRRLEQSNVGNFIIL